MKTAYIDYIYAEIGVKEEDVNAIAQSGDNGEAVRNAIAKGYIMPQFDKYSDAQRGYRVAHMGCRLGYCRRRLTSYFPAWCQRVFDSHAGSE